MVDKSVGPSKPKTGVQGVFLVSTGFSLGSCFFYINKLEIRMALDYEYGTYATPAEAAVSDFRNNKIKETEILVRTTVYQGIVHSKESEDMLCTECNDNGRKPRRIWALFTMQHNKTPENVVCFDCATGGEDDSENYTEIREEKTE